ncbi:hypothetical protein ACHAWC_008317 [Mediolabrus comicus]
MELSAAGQVKSGAQIRAERIRKGFCGTCNPASNPTKCYVVKKRFGGLKREEIPLTVRGKVLNGLCLKCHPAQDPDRRPESPNHNGTNSTRRVHSDRGAAGTLQTANTRLYNNNNRSAPPVMEQELDISGPDVEIIEEVTQNVYGETIIVEKPRVVTRAVEVNAEEKEEITMNNYQTAQNSDSKNSSMHVEASSSHNESDNRAQLGATNNGNEEVDNRLLSELLAVGSGEGGLTAIQRALQLACEQNPQLAKEIRKFTPGEGGQGFVPDSWLSIEEQSVNSEITDPTYMGTVVSEKTHALEERNANTTRDATRLYSRENGLSAITEVAESDGRPSDASSIQQRSIISHQICEPDVGDYFEAPPDLSNFQEVIDMCINSGEEGENSAIGMITDELIQNNGTIRNVDMALYCLHTLWILARRTEVNKQSILLEGNTFEAIIETMEIYSNASADIQTKACGLIWSLAMDQKDRKHVAELRGCEAVMNASMSYLENESLQVMALGALKVLSFHPTGKMKLRHHGAASIVAQIMSKHMQNPTIVSEGCVIISNLATEADGFVHPVSTEEIDAVLVAILSHPDDEKVVQVACFTLARLATSAINVETLKSADNTEIGLDIAIQRHASVVAVDVQTLVTRLRLN